MTIETPAKGEPLKPMPDFFGEVPPAPAKPKEVMDKDELANLVGGIGSLYNSQVEKLATGTPRDPRELIKWTADDTKIFVDSLWPVVKKYGWDSDAIFGLLLKYGPEIGCVIGIAGLAIVKIQAALAIRKAEKEGGRGARPPPPSGGGEASEPPSPIVEANAERYIEEAFGNATRHIRG